MDAKQHRDRRWPLCRCVLVSVVVIVGVALLILVLGLTVLRPCHPFTTVSSVRLGDLRVGLDIPNLAVILNVTLDFDLTTTNPNYVSFLFETGDAGLYYRGCLVGEATVPPGEVPAEGSVRSNISLTVMADRLIADSVLYADVISGSVLFTTTARVPGTVTIYGVFKLHAVAYTACDVSHVRVQNRSAHNSNCRYDTKF